MLPSYRDRMNQSRQRLQNDQGGGLDQKYDRKIQGHMYKQLLDNPDYLREQLMMLEPTNPDAI